MIEKMEGKQKATDIYIKPEISQFTIVSFEKGNFENGPPPEKTLNGFFV
jgi:NTE family protein